MSREPMQSNPKLEEGALSFLNASGYPFQYALLSLFQSIAKDSGWLFEVSEFPVSAGGKDTRIDFVLRPSQSRMFLSCECKRVNPDSSHWIFAKAPFVSRSNQGDDLFYAERIDMTQNSQAVCFEAKSITLPNSVDAYQLAFPMTQKGIGADAKSAGRDDIEGAVTQTLRGAAGLVNYMISREELAKSESQNGHRGDATIIPVLLTTANLWSTDACLKEASHQDGRLEPNAISLVSKKWLVHQYTISDSLSSDAERFDRPREFADTIFSEKTRSVAIVTPDGFEEFLKYMYAQRDKGHEIPWFS